MSQFAVHLLAIDSLLRHIRVGLLKGELVRAPLLLALYKHTVGPLHATRRADTSLTLSFYGGLGCWLAAPQTPS